MADIDPIDPEIAPDATEGPAPTDPQEAARSAGYSWSDIFSYIGKATQAAMSLGYSQDQVDQHLGADPAKADQDAKDTWTGHMAENPDLLDDAKNAQLDLSLSPTFRQDYADALTNRTVLGPADFSYRYAAGALSAAQDNFGMPTDDAQTLQTQQRALAVGAEGAMAGLPTNESLIDATLSLASPDAPAPDVIRKNLMEHWVDTGQPPEQAAMAAESDPALTDKLLAPPAKPQPSLFDGWLDQLRQATFEPMAAAIPEGAGQILDTFLNIGGTAQLAEEGVATGQPNAEATKALPPLMPGLERLGDLALFMQGGNAFGSVAPEIETLTANASKLVKDFKGAAETFQRMRDLQTLQDGGELKEFAIDPDVMVEAFKSASNGHGPVNIGNAMANLKLPMSSVVPEGPVGETLQALSPENMAKLADEKGPVHQEAARIANMTPEGREAALAKLEIPEGAEPGAEPLIDRAAVEEALPQYDTARGLYHYGRQLFSDVLNSEDGAVTAFHGTGVNFAGERGSPFGRFDLAKVGAGEGQQMFSWGMYFAENQKVAEWYQKADLARKGARPAEGSLYTVHIDVDPATQMANWELPFTQQPKVVQDAFTKTLGEWAVPTKPNALGVIPSPRDLSGMTGEDLFKRLMMEHGATVDQVARMTGSANKAASLALRDEGVKGMQFADGTTRGRPQSQWVMNHVIYDDKDISITHRNGLPVPANTYFQQMQQLFLEGKSRVGDAIEGLTTNAPAWRTPQQQIDWALFNARHDDAQMSIIKGQGRNQQNEALWANQLEKYQGLVSGESRNFDKLVAAGDVDGAMKSTIGNFISHYEGGGFGTTLMNSKLYPLSDALYGVNVGMRNRLEAAFNAGTIDLKSYVDNYYRHLWKNPRGDAWEGLTGSGKQGTGNSLKQRSLPTIEDGLRAGLIPKISNPIDLAMYDLSSKGRYLTSLEVIDEAKAAGHAYYAPSALDPKLDKPLLGVKSQFASDGTIIHLFGRDGYHQLYNNWLSSGVFAYPTSASLYEKSLWAGNALTQLKLLTPMFHMRVVGLASFSSGWEQAMREFGRGQFGWSALHAAEAMTMVGRPITDTTIGTMMHTKFKTGQSDEIVKYLSEAGLRIGKRQSIYNMGSESLGITARRGMAPGEGIWNNTKGAGREIMHRVGAAVKASAGDPVVETTMKRIFKGMYRVPLLPIDAAGTIMQTVTAPVFDHWIPAMKLGAAYRQLHSWLDANKMAGPEEKWAMARQIVKDVDNRYGELNQDTLFIPRLAKQLANQALVSTGWVYGSYRGFLGALGIDIERPGVWNKIHFQTSMATGVIGTVVGYALMNAVEQHLRGQPDVWQTGTLLHDLIGYSTGYFNKDGSLERGSSPSELKEIFDLGTIIAKTIADPGSVGLNTMDYILGKANTFWQLFHGVTTDEDGIGHHISDMPGGWPKYIKETLSPIFLEQIFHAKANSGFGTISGLLGDKAAPSWSQDWDNFQAMMKGVHTRQQKVELARAAKENMAEGKAPPEGYVMPKWMQKMQSQGNAAILQEQQARTKKAELQQAGRDAIASGQAPPAGYTPPKTGSGNRQEREPGSAPSQSTYSERLRAATSGPARTSGTLSRTPYSAQQRGLLGQDNSILLRGGNAPAGSRQLSPIEHEYLMERYQRRQLQEGRAWRRGARYITPGSQDIGGGAQGV